MNLARFARRRYTARATAIGPMPHLTKALSGAELFIKCDSQLEVGDRPVGATAMNTDIVSIATTVTRLLASSRSRAPARPTPTCP